MRKYKKVLKGYRVLLLNISITLAALADAMPIVKDYLPANWYAWLVFAGTIGNFWFRFLTDTPVGKSGGE